MAYDRLEPIGDRRLDLLAAHLASVVFNSMRLASGAKIEALGPEAFVPKWQVAEKSPEEQQEALKEKAKQAFAAFGGRASGNTAVPTHQTRPRR
jgi:hypothetical protein